MVCGYFCDDPQNHSYRMTAFDEMQEELDTAMKEIAHLISLGYLKSEPQMRRDLFRIGGYLSELRAAMEEEEKREIPFGKLPAKE